MQFTRERMARAQRAAQLEAGRRAPARRIGQTGFLEMRVPSICIHNAMRSEGPEVMEPDGKCYWDDMKKRHPELAVKQRQEKVSISMAQSGKRTSNAEHRTPNIAVKSGGKMGEILASGRGPGIPASKCQQ